MRNTLARARDRLPRPLERHPVGRRRVPLVVLDGPGEVRRRAEADLRHARSCTSPRGRCSTRSSSPAWSRRRGATGRAPPAARPLLAAAARGRRDPRPGALRGWITLTGGRAPAPACGHPPARRGRHRRGPSRDQRARRALRRLRAPGARAGRRATWDGPGALGARRRRRRSPRRAGRPARRRARDRARRGVARRPTRRSPLGPSGRPGRTSPAAAPPPARRPAGGASSSAAGGRRRRRGRPRASGAACRPGRRGGGSSAAPCPTA